MSRRPHKTGGLVRRGQMTHAGLAVMAVRRDSAPRETRLQSDGSALLIADADDLLHLGEEDFSVTDFPGGGGLQNRRHRGIDQVVGHHDFES